MARVAFCLNLGGKGFNATLYYNPLPSLLAPAPSTPAATVTCPWFLNQLYLKHSCWTLLDFAFNFHLYLFIVACSVAGLEPTHIMGACIAVRQEPKPQGLVTRLSLVSAIEQDRQLHDLYQKASTYHVNGVRMFYAETA